MGNTCWEDAPNIGSGFFWQGEATSQLPTPSESKSQRPERGWPPKLGCGISPGCWLGSRPAKLRQDRSLCTGWCVAEIAGLLVTPKTFSCGQKGSMRRNQCRRKKVEDKFNLLLTVSYAYENFKEGGFIVKIILALYPPYQYAQNRLRKNAIFVPELHNNIKIQGLPDPNLL